MKVGGSRLGKLELGSEECIAHLHTRLRYRCRRRWCRPRRRWSRTPATWCWATSAARSWATAACPDNTGKVNTTTSHHETNRSGNKAKARTEAGRQTPMSSPASASSPCAASVARRRGGSPRRPPFPGARSRRGRGDAMAGAARAPARTRARRLPSSPLQRSVGGCG